MRLTSLLAALMMTTLPAYAENHTDAEGATPMSESATQSDATDMTNEMPATMVAAEAIEDAIVYSLGSAYDESLWDQNEPFGPVTADWAEIGDVEDLILAQDGQVLGITVDVGGFLGLGERTVLVPLEDLRLVQNPDNGFYIVTRMARAELEEADEINGVIGD